MFTDTHFSAPAGKAKQYGSPYAFAAFETTGAPELGAALNQLFTDPAKTEVSLSELGALTPTIWDVKYGPGLQNDTFELDFATGEIVVKRTFGGFIETHATFTPRGDDRTGRYAVQTVRAPDNNENAAEIAPFRVYDTPTKSYHYNGSVSRFQIFPQGSRLSSKIQRISDPMTADPSGRYIGGGFLNIVAVAFILL